ncbi:homoserine dehydrogenase [Haladaptatus pallidirubidus]|uniref:homoserine dehydrogenase n=1 Tax=Haladaptatus pallidirubidus TaxID=1008152 RepID=A0AAV3UHK0_9EURY|nr:homoserine dehydrogenase [Haladaptatus pallidirubidus]
MQLGIIGAGAVGQAVASLAAEYGHTVTTLADSESAVVDSDGLDVETAFKNKESEGIIGNQDTEEAIEGSYEALIEVTPTTIGNAEPAFSHVKAALERDRHVVLSNKGPMAERYGDVRSLERDSEGVVKFEATVGGTMPVLSTISALGSNHITGIRGAFNSRANFILSRMAAESLEYEHVLAEAEELGVVKEDSSFDVEGIETALSCSILANVLDQAGQEIALDDVAIKGIDHLPSSTLELAQEDGRTIRLIGEIKDDRIHVGPQLVSGNGPLAVTNLRTVAQLETKYAGQTSVSGDRSSEYAVATTILRDVQQLERSR